MQTNADLFTPVHMATSNALLYPLNDGDQKFDAFEMDGFAVPEIDYPAITSFCPIPEETLLDPLFSPVDTAPSGSRFSLRKQLPCDLCSETFSSAQVLRLHRREKHIATKEFRCRKCPMSFNFESNLVLHMASHVPVQSVDKECPECSMVFKRISSFKGHLKSHQTNDRFKCNRCDKEFDLKGYYEKHLAKAHKPGADGTVEEILAKVENSARSRSKAKKPQGKYQCEACGKSFPKPCLLKRHEVAHTGARPFKCAECDQGFTQKTSLERHMLLHQGIKDFKCPKCNAGFSQKNNLIVHIKRTHPVHQNTENMFACEYCPCVFTKLNSVNRHKAMAHADRANAADHDGFNDDDDDNVNIARVMEQLKSFQESMGIRDMQPPALELSLMKPPSPGPKVRTVTLIDTLNPKKEKTYKTVKEIEYKGQRTMACIYCDKTFKRQFDLLRHHRTHTKERPFECEICQKSFATNAALKIHHNIHLSSQDKPAKVYTCAAPECGKRFSSMRRLDIHTKTHTSGISYICPLCSKTFTSKAGFSAHKHQPNDKEFDMIRPLLMPPVNIESNSADEAEKADEYSKRCHQCCVCGLKMKKLSHLRQHEATHKGDKPFKCTVCFRSYTTQSSLNLHKQIHAAEKRYICEVCDAKFITQSLLKRHMISHSDERKFECPYCSERFKTSDNCKNHILTHGRNLLASPEPPPEEENPWRVESGEAEEEGEAEGLGTISQPCIAVVQSEQSNMSPKFIQIEMVKNCRRHNHTNLTIETVPSTPKKSAKRSLARSLKQISQPGHQCGECRKTFYKASDLERHARTHTKEKPFACSLCAKTFALMSTLVQHRKTHDTLRETYDCQVCGKKYTSKKVLVVHLRLHTGERPFQCGVCQKTFRTSGHKISHMKSHHKKRK